MISNILILIILVVAVYIFMLKSTKIIILRSLLLPIMCMLFILCLIFFSDSSVKSAVKGIELWLYIVFPSLFPFFVGAELLYRTGFIKAAGLLFEPFMRPLFNIPGCGSFALVLGISSGYPVGAKITAGLRNENLLTKSEAERLLAFTNNSGPLFIFGAVSAGMFKLPQVGILLLLSHIAACLTVGFIFRFYNKERVVHDKKTGTGIFNRMKKELILSQKNSGSFASIFGDAVRESVMTIISIGGFIIFFSVILSVLSDIGLINSLASFLSIILKPFGISKGITASVLSGFFEITTGTNMASQVSGASLLQQLTVASLIIGWAGLSVHSQVISIISRTDISFKPYLVGKLMQGIISSIYTFIAIKNTGSHFLFEKPAFNVLKVPADSIKYTNIFYSLSSVFLIICIFLIPAYILFQISKFLSKA